MRRLTDTLKIKSSIYKMLNKAKSNGKILSFEVLYGSVNVIDLCNQEWNFRDEKELMEFLERGRI